jgi:hypothetical protein
MSETEIKRELFEGGAVRLSAAGCSFFYERQQPGTLLVIISGHDNGQFGTSTLDEIRAEIGREHQIELFVDAREALGAAVSVSDEWTRFFEQNQKDMKRVHVLVGSKVLHLTVSIAQHLSRTGNLIQVYTDPDLFRERLEKGKLAL